MIDERLLQDKYILTNVRQGGVSDFIEDEIRRICDCPKKGEKSIGDLFIDGSPLNIKTIDIGKSFHMPNLVSAKKAFDFLQKPENKLRYMFVEYEKNGDIVEIKRETIKEIEELSDVKIQAQGEGVIQLQSLTFRDHIDEFRVLMRDFINRQNKKWEMRWDYYGLQQKTLL